MVASHFEGGRPVRVAERGRYVTASSSSGLGRERALRDGVIIIIGTGVVGVACVGKGEFGLVGRSGKT